MRHELGLPRPSVFSALSSHADWLLFSESSLPIAYLPGLISSTGCLFLIASFESESYITTDRQSASLSWNKTPIWGLRPDFYYCHTVTGLLMWGALSDERTGLSFTTAAGPRQCSYFRVRVPLNSWPYFTVSDSRLHFSSPPTTRRVTVEVFDPASARECFLWVWVLCYDRRLVGQSVLE
jgi:hypothetical protein